MNGLVIAELRLCIRFAVATMMLLVSASSGLVITIALLFVGCGL